jgi:hypothetical protein
MVGSKDSRSGVSWLERALDSGVAMMRLKGPFRPDARVFTLKASISRVQEITENSISSLLILQYPGHILQ